MNNKSWFVYDPDKVSRETKPTQNMTRKDQMNDNCAANDTLYSVEEYEEIKRRKYLAAIEHISPQELEELKIRNLERKKFWISFRKFFGVLRGGKHKKLEN